MGLKKRVDLQTKPFRFEARPSMLERRGKVSIGFGDGTKIYDPAPLAIWLRAAPAVSQDGMDGR